MAFRNAEAIRGRSPAVARAFNSGCGTAQHLDFALHRLVQVVERFWQVRKLGYPYAV